MISGISWPQILVLLVIVLLVFGTKRIRNIGSDLGGAIREFRKGVGEDEEAKADSQKHSAADGESQDDESTSGRDR